LEEKAVKFDNGLDEMVNIFGVSSNRVGDGLLFLWHLFPLKVNVRRPSGQSSHEPEVWKANARLGVICVSETDIRSVVGARDVGTSTTVDKSAPAQMDQCCGIF
jgi:hypothetical protein